MAGHMPPRCPAAPAIWRAAGTHAVSPVAGVRPLLLCRALAARRKLGPSTAPAGEPR